MRYTPPRNRSAFALIELLTITAILVLLMSIMASGFTRATTQSKSIRCLNNHRQLTVAWRMYTSDFQDRMVVAVHGGGTGGPSPVGIAPYGVGWCSGWLDWASSSDNTNTALLTDRRFAKLADYAGHVSSMFKCPADIFLSGIQQQLRWLQRVRSISGNILIGAGNYESGPSDPIYRHVTKMSDFMYPGPAQVWVFVDEHPDSINDPAFFNAHQTSWVDIPTTLHSGGCGFGFADGHSEIHKWSASLTKPRAGQVKFTDGSDLISAVTTRPGDADIHWFSYHSPRLSAYSY